MLTKNIKKLFLRDYKYKSGHNLAGFVLYMFDLIEVLFII